VEGRASRHYQGNNRNIGVCADVWYVTEIKSEDDLIPPGAEPGTIPTDIEQATGLERLEILGKMQGIDIFDMRPLPADRVGMYHETGARSTRDNSLQFKEIG